MKVLITGASSGIGRQLALDYAADGNQVIVCGRNDDALSELQKQYPEKYHVVLLILLIKNQLRRR